MIYTGMRPGELRIQQKSNVFLDKDYMIGGIKIEAGIDREITISEKTKPIVESFYYQNPEKPKLLNMSEKIFTNNIAMR